MLNKNSAILVLTMGFGVLLSRPADALPSFAKAYGVQCSVCHTVPPQLNAYGRYIQRTGYAALTRDVLEKGTPITFSENPTLDTSTGSGHIEFGNEAVHAAGYLTPSITFHIHQWLVQNGQIGGLDTFQFAYNFKDQLHLFAGKLSALPVPAPFSNGSDLSPYATAELQVGEHMYQSDMMRWGSGLSYVGKKIYAQINWLGANTGWNGATDFSADTDKTFQWIAAYADPANPFEAGVFGSVGALPLVEGGVDRYNTIAGYVQRDPGPNYVPGVFAVYQLGNDGNPGNPASVGMGLPLGSSLSDERAPFAMGSGSATSSAARSRAFTLEAYESLMNGSVILGVRKEFTDDGMGTLRNTAAVDLGITPITSYQYLHLYLEGATQPGMGPAWRGMAWWAVPVGR